MTLVTMEGEASELAGGCAKVWEGYWGGKAVLQRLRLWRSGRSVGDGKHGGLPS